ncbi:type II CAAX endopeptidase family protein [Streptomyces sp. NPDC005438]|uniref:CPBP family intramembrane glutamic endopeptidase n=1 Tax=Streptomyces sp. NPDC005438 TaxID=3156880 RepID=UPI00339DFAB2
MAAFFAVTFGAAWAYLFAARLWWDLSLVNPLVQLPYAVAPALGALVARRWVGGDRGPALGLGLRLRQSWPFYLLAWLGPFGAVAATMTLAWALGHWDGDLSAARELSPGIPLWGLVMVLLILVPLLSPIYGGEEFGWTSYLRPRMFRNHPRIATFATGIIWAAWHYPLAFLGYIEFQNVTAGLTVWTFSFLCQEVILAWFFVRSGSAWVTSLAHAGNNLVFSLLTGALLEEKLSSVEGSTLLSAVPLALLSALILLGPSARRHDPVPSRADSKAHA